MQNSIHQNLSQCTFNFEALADQPYEPPKLHLVQTQPQKYCTGCHKWLPATFEYFSKYKRSKDGFRSRCKICINSAKWKWMHQPKISISSKECTNCHEVKSVNKFNKTPETKDGYSQWCKECFNAKKRVERRQRKADFEAGILTRPADKECPKCHRVLHADEFAESNDTKIGLSSWCRSCCIEYTRDARRERNRKDNLMRIFGLRGSAT